MIKNELKKTTGSNPVVSTGRRQAAFFVYGGTAPEPPRLPALVLLLCGLPADSSCLAKVPASGGPLMRTCIYWAPLAADAAWPQGAFFVTGALPPTTRGAFYCHERDHSSISSLSRQ